MEIGDKFSVENKFKKQFKEVICFSYQDGLSAYLNNTWRMGSLKILIQNEEDIDLLEGFIGDDYFCSEGFSDVELLSTDDLIEESWEFEDSDELEQFQDMFEEVEDEYDDFQQYLENCHGFRIEKVYYEVEDGGTNVTKF
jgi:hypothetical protein